MIAALVLAAESVPEPGGVSDRAHLLLAAVVIGALVFTLAGVRRARLRSRYSLLWLTICFALVPLAAFPGLLDRVAVRLGVSYPPALILLVSVAFLFLLMVQLSWETSRADDRLRILSDEVSMLRAELDAERRAKAAPGRGPTAGTGHATDGDEADGAAP